MDTWFDANNKYLEASLHWLRLRLEQLLPDAQATSPIGPREGSEKSRGSRLPKWMQGHAENRVKLLTAGHPPPLDEQIEEAERERNAAAKIDPPPALLLLADRFGLSPFERDTLFLCAAPEFDPAVSSLCATVQGSLQRNYPTFSLALSLFDSPSWDVLSARRPLRFERFIEINQPGALPLTAGALRADERIVNFLKGLNEIDDRLLSYFEAISSNESALLSVSQELAVEEILRRLDQADPEVRLPIVQLVGADAGSRLAISQAVGTAVNRRLYRLWAEMLPSSLPEIETLARLWQRESFLLPVALYLDAESLEGLSTEGSAALQRFLAREVGLVLVGMNESPLRLSIRNFAIEVKKPTRDEQCDAWTRTIEGLNPTAVSTDLVKTLTGQFNLSVSDIRQAALMAFGLNGDFGKSIWQVCRDLTRPRLDSLAQRLEPKMTWTDLVLPEEQMSLMHQIAVHVRERYRVYDEWGFALKMNRGFGITALFTGESGTGKTMAAEVLANDLALNLYRIDLSAVVSKYIGETEKNLRKVFDAAEQGGAILFFDEADALFGKRSEVKDSHDRYANIEINYLLQRMEAFSGLAILATNMKSALDPAFMRRLRFIVNLPFPGPKERKQIWERALPPHTPTKDLDYERLARMSLTGGNIQSIALNAAFMAAQDGQTVTMPILLAAARRELRKLEKPISDAEFRLMSATRI